MMQHLHSQDRTSLARVAALTVIGSMTSAGLVLGNSPTTIEQEQACMANLRQIGKALRTYAQEWGQFPPELADLQPRSIGNKKVLYCPSSQDHLGKGLDPGWVDRKQTTYQYFVAIAGKLSQTPGTERPGPASAYLNWAQARAIRGKALPIVFCGLHDPHFGQPHAHVGGTGTGLVLRVDGSVSKANERAASKAIPSRHRPRNAFLWWMW